MEHTATYSPEDNKIRIYPGRRLDDELGDEYKTFKSAGFIWAAKQECFVCPRWTPQAEDWAIRLAGEIGDEDYSMTERSADRAERFEDYRVKRSDEADAHAEKFESGPSVFGHQNADRAERQARRHERNKFKALTQWGKAEYWQYRTAGVIAHALHRARPDVRRGRIKVLEAEQRKHEKERQEYADTYAAFEKVLLLDGLDTPIRLTKGWTENTSNGCIMHLPEEVEPTPAGKLVYFLANNKCHFGSYKHPRRDLVPGSYNEGRRSIYDLLTDETDPVTPREAAELWLANAPDPENENSSDARWSRHYELRLTYERAMLENEGGTAAAVEMVPGGWIRAGNRTGSVFTDVPGGKMQIHGVTRSPVTKQVTSVKVMGTAGIQNPRPALVSINIERLPEDAYIPPTEEELQRFKVETAERKSKEKATKEPALALINPTMEDANRLQKILNDIARAKYEANRQPWEKAAGYEYKPEPVLKMTQAQYSANSKGEYSSFETRTLHNGGGVISRRSSNMYSSHGKKYDDGLGKAVCKVRARSGNNCPHIIVITDKPQKPLPVDWTILESLTQVQHEVA